MLFRPAIPFSIFFTLLAGSAPGAEPDLDFAACEAGFSAAPNTESSADCFYDVGRSSGRTSEAAERIRKHLSLSPGHPWLSHYLAHLLSLDNKTEQASALYEEAARTFSSRRDPRGEVLARSNLQRLLDEQGRTAEAGREAERAEQVADASGDAELIARAKVVRARHLFLLGKDLDRVYLLLRRAEEFAFPKGPYTLQRECLSWLGNVSLEIGRPREAQRYFQRLADLAAREGDDYAEANARYNLARSFLDGVAELPQPGYKEQALALARRSLAKAEEGKHRATAAKSHWLLGLLLTGEEAHRHLDACLRVADTLRDRSYCLNALARHLSGEDPRRGREASQEALALAHQTEDSWGMAYAWRERMRASWASGSRKQAIADSQAALKAIETLRDIQGGAASRVGLFSSWSDDYAWFSGRLLEAWSSGQDPVDLDGAFETMERKRARTLLDALAAARAAPAQPATLKPLQERLSQVHEEISQVQRQLLDPDVAASLRTAAQAGLERLELEEQDLRGRIDEASPALTALRAPTFASLARVRTALAPDEALVSFQIAPDRDVFDDFAGGSWIVVSTRSGSRAWRLRRDRVALRPAVELFNGLFARRDGSEAEPAAGL